MISLNTDLPTVSQAVLFQKVFPPKFGRDSSPFLATTPAHQSLLDFTTLSILAALSNHQVPCHVRHILYCSLATDDTSEQTSIVRVSCRPTSTHNPHSIIKNVRTENLTRKSYNQRSSSSRKRKTNTLITSH
jgi:hypothetical protein